MMRPFQKLSESGNETESWFGSRLVVAITEMLTTSHVWRDGACDDDDYFARIELCCATVMDLMEVEGARHQNGRIREPCKSLLKHKNRFFLFVDSKDIQPTNNVAERIVRSIVILRHLTQGTHSDLGTKFVERTQTVVACCILQARSILRVFIQAMRGEAVSILPSRLALDTT